MKPRFVITIEAANCECEYRSLRALLKVLLRRFGFRCLNISAKHESFNNDWERPALEQVADGEAAGQSISGAQMTAVKRWQKAQWHRQPQRKEDRQRSS
jgi:hypothetical protein